MTSRPPNKPRSFSLPERFHSWSAGWKVHPGSPSEPAGRLEVDAKDHGPYREGERDGKERASFFSGGEMASLSPPAAPCEFSVTEGEGKGKGLVQQDTLEAAPGKASESPRKDQSKKEDLKAKQAAERNAKFLGDKNKILRQNDAKRRQKDAKTLFLRSSFRMREEGKEKRRENWRGGRQSMDTRLSLSQGKAAKAAILREKDKAMNQRLCRLSKIVQEAKGIKSWEEHEAERGKIFWIRNVLKEMGKLKKAASKSRAEGNR
uniref:Uncharacterized protein n=1 Tax=Chromera velia CCMP2878 TaxID=1169474 RepID=A0A0G4IDI9_9ALVE|eukprot:Cvel_13287.t1-p1 / transcript=Cvel_13287.t1 / gene=Cvel_13287 / organism=Chromera_velia_CCMP2878 / gene_product=hypothetical protein / transcript_product=hypothetical protein / location=Cvel_scaffold901:48463-51677(-) / protein_length=261 / sequence_SO=supercontig / SO=protein_coding / is_pseudo=false